MALRIIRWHNVHYQCFCNIGIYTVVIAFVISWFQITLWEQHSLLVFKIIRILGRESTRFLSILYQLTNIRADFWHENYLHRNCTSNVKVTFYEIIIYKLKSFHISTVTNMKNISELRILIQDWHLWGAKTCTIAPPINHFIPPIR